MLFCLTTSGGQQFWLVEGVYVFGRDLACDLIVMADGISRRHATISVTSDGMAVHDLGSTNGTFLNGQRITRQEAACHGDTLSFGDSVCCEVLQLELADPVGLLLLAQPMTGHWVLPPGEYDVGRDPGSAIFLPDDSVSAHHLRLRFDGRSVMLQDAGSTNGIWIEKQRIRQTTATLPQAIRLGDCRLFLSLTTGQTRQPSTHAGTPNIAVQARHDPPSTTVGNAVAIGAFAGLLLLIAGAVVYEQGWLNQSVANWSASGRPSAVEIQRRQQVQQAHRIVASVASDPAMRDRIRTLAQQTRQIERSLRPLLSEIDRFSVGLQRLTGNSALRRMLSGTDLGAMINQTDRILHTGRNIMNDLQSMPADLNALDAALARYQARPSRDTLVALVEPAGRAAVQADRIHSGARTMEQALGLGANQLSRLADTSLAWSFAPEISQTAAQASDSAREAQNAVATYRQTLGRDLEKIRRIQNEARIAQRSQR